VCTFGFIGPPLIASLKQVKMWRAIGLGALTRAVRNISRRKMRAMLVIIALSFSLAIMVSIPAGVVANQESMQSTLARFNGTITETEEQINQTTALIECSTSGGNMFFSSPYDMRIPPSNMSGFPSNGFRDFTREEFYINDSVVGNISSIAGVKDVVPFLTISSSETTGQIVSTPMGQFTMSRSLYTINGVCLNSSVVEEYSLLPTNITMGRNLQEGDSGVLLMSLNLTEYYGIDVGSKVDVNGTSFTVVGIYDEAGQGSTGARSVYMNLTDVQTVMGETGNVSRLDVYAENASSVDSIYTQIQAMYSAEINDRQISVTTYSQRLASLQSQQADYSNVLGNATSTMAQTQTVATQEIIVVLGGTSLIVLFVMLYTVRERTKEIGTLKAIGLSNWNVMSQFMLEGVILSLAAGVVGIVIGTVGAPILSSDLLPAVNTLGSRSIGFQTGGFASALPPGSSAVSASSVISAVVSPTIMLLALGAAVFLGVVGSLYPAWRASRIKPAEAMRYE
jgi:putative ABC transport system permease protein